MRRGRGLDDKNVSPDLRLYLFRTSHTLIRELLPA